MRILLDECLPRRLAGLLLDHETCNARQMGWYGIKNGKLLELASQSFDVFLTVDKNLEAQQNLGQFSIGVVVLCCKSNRLADIEPLVPHLLTVLARGSFRGAQYLGM